VQLPFPPSPPPNPGTHVTKRSPVQGWGFSFVTSWFREDERQVDTSISRERGRSIDEHLESHTWYLVEAKYVLQPKVAHDTS